MAGVVDQTPNTAETAENLFSSSGSIPIPTDYSSIREKVIMNGYLYLV